MSSYLKVGGALNSGKMQILKDAGSFEIFTNQEEMDVQLKKIERMGRTCYQSEKGEITKESAEKFIRMIINRGHESVLEHGIISVRFNNCSRGFTHELVRHRLMSPSQESTRYVDYAKGEVDLDEFQICCVVPPHRDEHEKIALADGREMSMTDMFGEIEHFYRALRKARWAPEDARQILPIGLRSQVGVTANFREWRYILALRTSRYAHWEIRKVMGDLAIEFQKLAPCVFENLVEAGKDKNGLRYFEK